MKLYDIIKIYGFDPSDFRFVRHVSKEIIPLEVFKKDSELFDAYQSLQRKGKFGDAKYIASFASYHGTQALLLGVWEIEGEAPAATAPTRKLDLTERFGWSTEKHSYYKLSQVDAFNDLSERLIIAWGGSPLTWVMRKDMEVLSILQLSEIQEFQSFEHTIISHGELVKLIKNPSSNATWFNALRSVNGIYCIMDTDNGKLYVGSAYGKNGIWSRWKDYAATGHGGNKLLIELLAEEPDAVKKFQFSVLEILPGSSTVDDAIAKENLWKDKLGSRINGYNEN